MKKIARRARLRTRLLPLLLFAAVAACDDLATGPAPEGDLVRGIDVSHWQGAIDWRAVEAGGIAFAFAKATEGATHTDPAFAANWAGMGGTRIIRGAYHFFRPQTDPAAQAAHFLRTVQLGASDLPPALDVEVTDGVDRATLVGRVLAWLDAVEQGTGKRPIVYTYQNFHDTHLAGSLAGYPLWIARYGGTPPSVPGWRFWQYSDAGSVSGIPAAVDLDWFNGSEAELRTFVQAQGRAALGAAW
jgi:lysozyme